MWDRRGYSLIELTVSLAVLSLMATMIGISGVGFVSSERRSNAAKQVIDAIALARARTSARYEEWQIAFTLASGSKLVTSYILQYCKPPVGGSALTDCQNASDWTSDERGPVILPLGTGVQVPLVGGQPVKLRFDRTGVFYLIEGAALLNKDVNITVCSAAIDSSGALSCRPGTATRTVQVRKFSGIAKEVVT